MVPTLEQLGIDRLSTEERIALAQEILDTIVAERAPAPLSDAKRHELQRRLAEHTANPNDAIPWEQIQAESARKDSQVSLPLVFLRTARYEFDEAVDWYERRRTGRGAKFSASVQAVFDRIVESPQFYPKALEDVRKALVPKYPYCIYYRVEDDKIVVLAVFYTSRDPSNWQRRV